MSTNFGRDDDRDHVDVDLSQLRADDALLDALGGADPKLADELGEAELNALLLSWSREVDGEPMPELVDVDTAVTTIKSVTVGQKGERRERRRRLLVPIAAAASVLVIAFGGASVAAREAVPGDTLWGLTQVLYADKADSVQASFEVKAEFNRAREAMHDGQLDTARDALDKARASLDSVRDEENHDGLTREHQELMTQLRESDGTPVDDGDDETTTPNESTSSSSTSSEPSSTSSEPPLIQPDPGGSESTSPSSSPSEEPDPSESPSSTTTSRSSTSDSSAQSDDSSTSDSGTEIESRSEPVG